MIKLIIVALAILACVLWSQHTHRTIDQKIRACQEAGAEGYTAYPVGDDVVCEWGPA